MWIRIYIGVTFLILIQKSASEAVSLPSPANVSIQCDSYGVEVRWEYPDLHQDIYFQVKLKSESGERNSNLTQNLRLNISSMLSNVAYNRFYVNVTAVRGGQKSNSTRSDYFGYNILSLINIKCYLDFPEVKLSPKDGKLLVQFINPLQLYRNSPALPNFVNDLEYSIQTEEDMYEEVCKRKQNTSCETSVEFSEHRGVYCVNLTGTIGQSSFNPRSSCFTGDIRSYVPVTVYLYPVLGVVLTLLFITPIIMLLAKKCNSEIKKKVRKEDIFQYFFDFGKTQSHLPGTLDVKPDVVVKDVQIEPVEDPEEITTRIPFIDNNPGISKPEDKSYGPSDLVADEQSNQSDFYDCPHAPRQRQEMSPGDTVDGYGPKLLLDF